MKGFRGIALATGLLVALGCAAVAGKGAALEELSVRGATTPDEHVALAGYFRAKAEDARTEARRHERLARNYSRGLIPSFKTRAEMKEHCDRIASAQQSLATEYEELALLHDQEAAQTP